MESFGAVAESFAKKEGGHIRQALQLIDRKQFTKALKHVEKALETYPENGEALSLKGNILSSLGRKEEALDFAKRGLMKNLKSALCWFSLSLIQNLERNYTEAYKSIQKANAISPNNPSIVRNLSLLQLQTRDYKSFRDTRLSILTGNPGVVINWASYAVAEHLSGDNNKACQVIDSFLKSMDKQISKNELSEIYLFKAKILEEMKDYKAMEKWLNENKAAILDQVLFKELIAKALLEQGDKESAEVIVRDLLSINPEQAYYHELLQKCRSQQEILGVYAELQRTYPRSTMPFRTELDLVDSSAFAEPFDRYMTARVRKGIPSLFSNIRALLKLPAKAEIIVNTIRAHISTLKAAGSFAVINHLNWSVENGPKEQPQCLMWILLLMSKIQDYLKNFEEALAIIDEAIDHTPTVPDLYLAKGRILKHMGRLPEAINVLEDSRNLDLSDRYLNNKSAKYMYRNNQVAEAEELLGLFSRERGELNIHDMQSTWVEIEMAEAYLRIGEIEKAKTEFAWVDRQYYDMFDDQCDFHFYVIRKMNLNNYASFLKFADTLYSQKPLLRAGKGLIKCHLANPDVYSLKEAQKMAAFLLKHHPEDEELNELGTKIHV